MVNAPAPVVCIEAPLELEESLGGARHLTRSFVSWYIEMWPERFEAHLCRYCFRQQCGRTGFRSESAKFGLDGGRSPARQTDQLPDSAS